MTVSVREQSRLHRSCGPLVQSHPGKSGIFALPDGLDAFAARVLLAGAADRGLRVRLLLDDNNTKGLDPTLAALDAHPNIEIRLFNAFKWRRWRLLGYLTDFRRLNRRMHNKSFTADGQATIIGGGFRQPVHAFKAATLPRDTHAPSPPAATIQKP